MTKTPKEYVEDNYELILEILKNGDTEARSYALAVLARGGTNDDISEVKSKLEKIEDNESVS